MGRCSPVINGYKRPGNRGTRVQKAAKYQRQQILEGLFSIGEVLPSEGEMAEEMGVSRTVIQEAMRNLHTQGLVEVYQGRRPRVRSLDPTMVIDSLNMLLYRSAPTIVHLIQVRRLLERETAALAAQHANETDRAKLVEAIDDLRVAPSTESCIAADIAFHRCLAKASGNPGFVLPLDAIRGSLARTERTLFPRAGQLPTIENPPSRIRGGQIL